MIGGKKKDVVASVAGMKGCRGARFSSIGEGLPSRENFLSAGKSATLHLLRAKEISTFHLTRRLLSMETLSLLSFGRKGIFIS